MSEAQALSDSQDGATEEVKNPNIGLSNDERILKLELGFVDLKNTLKWVERAVEGLADASAYVEHTRLSETQTQQAVDSTRDDFIATQVNSDSFIKFGDRVKVIAGDWANNTGTIEGDNGDGTYEVSIQGANVTIADYLIEVLERE